MKLTWPMAIAIFVGAYASAIATDRLTHKVCTWECKVVNGNIQCGQIK